MKAWVKTVVVAAIGGGVPAGFTAVMDPQKFGIHFGNGRLLLIMLQGAAVAVGALWLRSPQGQQIMGAFKQGQQQGANDLAMLQKAKSDLQGTPAPGLPSEKNRPAAK